MVTAHDAVVGPCGEGCGEVGDAAWCVWVACDAGVGEAEDPGSEVEGCKDEE